ncbi:type II toxin-antitoxin system CcdA family antitoxin [Vibrio ezurae]|uniref:Post-segregation antitoxin CcdA n=1 Tax=Vibrio ezurae NBRC 102218 TaxID=1219080 RepID=U3AGN7_9VIBR|nr:type II toxin-antitoxin system CcdA family antitoxin [Vibrio ezurae]GAD79096.1 hypothetical protein VEZ01S_08_01320 [Vibrio ezurae NBRC 102218]
MRRSFNTQARNKATMENTLGKGVTQRTKEEWQEQNAEALTACNELTRRHGLFSDSHRVF